MTKEFDFSRAVQGRHLDVPSAEDMPKHTKVRIVLWIDLDVLNHFKALADEAGGESYAPVIAAHLRRAVRGDRE